jgi:MerR family mercuric resistance operon transcriptional regulator
MPVPFTIGRLARSAGVNVETVRYYQRRGLLAQPQRGAGSIRRYSEADADRLRFVRQAQAMGFSLAEIGALLAVKERGSCTRTRQLAEQKLAEIDERVRELKRFRRDLSSWIAACADNADDAQCPALSALDLSSQRRS